jgi:hypothetical protein
VDDSQIPSQENCVEEAIKRRCTHRALAVFGHRKVNSSYQILKRWARKRWSAPHRNTVPSSTMYIVGSERAWFFNANRGLATHVLDVQAPLRALGAAQAVPTCITPLALILSAICLARSNKSNADSDTLYASARKFWRQALHLQRKYLVQ